MIQDPVISVSNLRKRFNLEAGFFAPLGRYVYAVNGVSFSIGKNEAYGLVGESGCGKTTTARLLVRMYEADEGEILFHGYSANEDANASANFQDVRKLKGSEFKRYREKVKYIFQDPARSLNPRMTVYEVLCSGAKWSANRRREKDLREDAVQLLLEVGLSASDLERRPAEFSGGQRQRLSIARGLMMNPDILICDEVVSALDVSIQGQILNLLLDLRERREISFLFIAHDLKIACYFCDRIGVMYRGEIMEEAPAPDLWKGHLHPYTELLFSSVKGTSKNHTASSSEASAAAPHTQVQTADAPAPRAQAAGAAAETRLKASESCAFAPRCPYAQERCFREKPVLREAGSGHLVSCHKI